jgi:membrane protein DedA with SNARE-associated domain
MNLISYSLGEIAKHGYLVLFAWVTAEQLGAPLPAVPILIAAGVLSVTGRISLANALVIGIVGCLIGDAAWYGIGKRWGPSVLRTLCKISFEPETCVRQGSNLISRHGSRALIVSKFVPGVSTVAVPLVANSGASLSSFLFCDLLGSVLYVGAYLALGRIVGDRIDKLLALARSIGSASAAFVALGTVAIVGYRYQQRWKFRRLLRMSRITPDELHDLIERGLKPFIVDLRHRLDSLSDPRAIPGAVRLMPDELAARRAEIPTDREIILYCT